VHAGFIDTDMAAGVSGEKVSPESVANQIVTAVASDAEEVLDEHGRIGIDVEALAAKLQSDGAAAFSKSWDSLLACIAEKRAALKKAG